MIAEGADIIDVGGESTRPGSEPVSEARELERVVPVIAALSRLPGALVSVDTTKARVAAESIAAGAQVINDISALRGDPGMGRVAAETGAGVVLMHMLGSPKSMQENPVYGDVVAEIAAFLKERMAAAAAAGIAREAVVVDPGFGFGKTVEHNLAILGRLREFESLGRPLLVGPSRKSFIGKILGGLPPEDRLEGTGAVVALAIAGGAAVIRVHDVEAMVRVGKVVNAVLKPAG